MFLYGSKRPSHFDMQRNMSHSLDLYYYVDAEVTLEHRPLPSHPFLPRSSQTHMQHCPESACLSTLFLMLKVDMSCMVSSIKWYHEMENGTEVLIKVNNAYPIIVYMDFVCIS